MMRAAGLPLALALLPATANGSLNMDLAEIYEIDELTAVDISLPTAPQAVPTGYTLDVSQNFDSVAQLNLPMWAHNVTQHSLATIKRAGNTDNWSPHLIQSQIASAIDVDLSTSVCTLPDEVGRGRICNVTLTPTEDHNRFLDLRVLLSTFGRFPTTLKVRVVVAEDASKAVKTPLSFNVRVSALRVGGVDIDDHFIGRNMAPAAAVSALDAAQLPWANGTLVDAVVATTVDFPWAACSNRSVAAAGEGTPDFVDAITTALTALLSPGFALSFQTSAITAHNGIAFQVSFSCCGHLMDVPATIQSTDPAAGAAAASTIKTDDDAVPTIQLSPNHTIARVPSTHAGLIMEGVNHALYGYGLGSQMVFGEGFEEPNITDCTVAQRPSRSSAAATYAAVSCYGPFPEQYLTYQLYPSDFIAIFSLLNALEFDDNMIRSTSLWCLQQLDIGTNDGAGGRWSAVRPL